MIYSSTQLPLHSKCIVILELIKQAEERFSASSRLLDHYDSEKNCFAPIKLMNTRHDLIRKIENLEAVRSRLLNYYLTTVDKINTSIRAKC